MDESAYKAVNASWVFSVGMVHVAKLVFAHELCVCAMKISGNKVATATAITAPTSSLPRDETCSTCTPMFI